MAIVLGVLVIIGAIILAYYTVGWIIDKVKKHKDNCSKCGAKLTLGDGFCPSCGEKV
jgi:rRNA maturation endonuclease Nob1